MSQRARVEEILRNEGKVSNWYSIDSRLSIRLGAIIFKLRKEGWEIETYMNGKECIYKLIKAPEPRLF